MDEGYPEDVEDDDIDAYRLLSLAGLPFQHVHLSVNPGGLNETCKFIKWWSSTFRALSDSKATIHFTELTFTFPALQDIDTLEEAWNSLDNSLAHTTFSGVRNIHFERSRREGRVVVRAAYSPVIADRMLLSCLGLQVGAFFIWTRVVGGVGEAVQLSYTVQLEPRIALHTRLCATRSGHYPLHCLVSSWLMKGTLQGAI
ncbi:hypothetical protein BDZ89DRAFT_1148440 [Hymenopellis radicata]|nr:hypothetical protein BDZ89DRAFT_1148440 [Hymenopellis radicata]